MADFVKPIRKTVEIKDAFAELLGKTTKIFAPFVMEPVFVFVIILMAFPMTQKRSLVNFRINTSLLRPARTVITE